MDTGRRGRDRRAGGAIRVPLSVPTNDNLVDVLGAALASCSVRCVISSARWWAVAVGAILGLVAVTKLSALPVHAVLIPIAWSKRESIRRVQTVALAAGSAVIMSAWYFVQNAVRYGDPLALAAARRYLQAIGGLGTVGFPYVVRDPLHLVFVAVPANIWQGFRYTSGWNQFAWPWWVDLIFWAALAFALSGLAAAGALPSHGVSARLHPRSDCARIHHRRS